MQALYQRADFPSYRACRTSHESRHIYCTQDAWVEAQGYLLAVCLERNGIELHGGCLFFTHDHFDIGHPWEDDALVEPRYSSFWQDFRFEMWRLLKLNQGWKHGPVYNRLKRTHQGPVLDAEEFWRVLCYDTAQAVAAGLYQRTSDYPGLVFLPEDVLRPRVFKRNKLIAAIDPYGLEFPETEASIQLGVPRIFSHLTREEYAEVFAKKLKEYEDEVGPRRVHPAYKTDAYCNSIPIGKKLGLPDILEHTRGHEPPPHFTQSFEPVYTSKSEIRVEYYEERQGFRDKHSAAYRSLKAGLPNVCFPAGTYGWRLRLNVPVLSPSMTSWAGQPPWYPD